MKIAVPTGSKVMIAFATIEIYEDQGETMNTIQSIKLDDVPNWFSLFINGDYAGQYACRSNSSDSLILKNVVRIDDCSIYMEV